MKYLLLFYVLFLSQIAIADEIGSILKRNNGTILYTTYSEAEKHCEEIGMHLPTFRNYAEDAVSYGSKIRESAYKGQNSNSSKVSTEIIQNLKVGYELQTTGRDIIDFYYNANEYQKTNEDLENPCFWTTTQALDYGAWSYYVFCSNNGRKSTANQVAWLAVRCIKNE
jgi:hypothetical protein